VNDRSQDIVEGIEGALETRARAYQSKRYVDLAVRQSSQLAESLERLAAAGLVTALVTPEDLLALRDELSAFQKAPRLEPLIASVTSLLAIAGDELVEGDAARLRAALNRAQEVVNSTERPRAEGQPQLPTPVRVRCTSCDDIVVGRRSAALNWHAVTKQVRDHERDRHGGYSEELRDDLRRAHDRLNAGEKLVEAGRYEIGGAGSPEA
jgi:hypothetical protein